MDVVVLNALNDNFMYLLIDRASNSCAVIDPVEPQKVCNYVEENHLTINYILTTHHHWDHAGGNKNLVSLLKNPVTVVGGDDRIDELNLKVVHGQKIEFGNIEIECLHTPCHTTGHICYVAQNKTDQSEDHVVFTGDTLFISGCGRFFEGTAIQMYHALIEILAKLPPSTKVYCGHEYTEKNLRFALTIEPNNENTKQKLNWAQNQIAHGNNTVPSTIGDELLINPFMRVDKSEVCKKCEHSDPVKVMEILRKLKDDF